MNIGGVYCGISSTVLVLFLKTPKDTSKKLLEAIYSREWVSQKCLFCQQKKNLHMHHLKPKSEGGTDEPENLIPVCPNHHAKIHTEGLHGHLKLIAENYSKKLKSRLNLNKIRAHGFIFKLIIPSIKNWDKRRTYLEKSNIFHKDLFKSKVQAIVFKEHKVWLCDNSIIVYFPKFINYFTEEANTGKNYAIADFIMLIKKLENFLKVSFKINKKYKFKVSKQHYSLLRNSLAKQYNKQGKLLHIYTPEGELWFIIDNSYKLEEVETLHSKTAVEDMDDIVKPFFNQLRETRLLPKDILKFHENTLTIVNKVSENQLMFDKNFQSHLKVINQLSKAVDELRKEIKTNKIYNK